jgi:hypothetical protein
VTHESGTTIIQFLPLFVFLLVSIPFAIGNGYLAPRLGKSAAIWVILTLIPIINSFFAIYVFYKVIFAVLDRSARAAATGAPGPA